MLAETGARFSILMPTIDAQMQGASYGDVFKLLGKPSLSSDDALDMATSLGTHNTEITASASTGVLLPQMDLQANATIRTQIKPNDEFKAWAKAGADPLLLGNYNDPKAEVKAGGLANLPSFGIGFHLPARSKNAGQLAVGVRVRTTQAYYSHYIVDAQAIADNQPRRSDEMGDNDYIKQGSFAADFGVTYSPKSSPNARLALVVNNLIEPKAIDFGPTAPAGTPSVQLAPRSFSVGAAVDQEFGTLALDVVDLTGAYGKAQVRLGGEVRAPGGLLALRGGYNTATGFTAGIGLGSFGIAYSNETPIMLSQSITF
jgi:hypothetical protein